MDPITLSSLQNELNEMKDAGLFKEEKVIHSPQSTQIQVSRVLGAESRSMLNFCANNYLGLANHPEIIQAAKDALDQYGFGLSSVRFICGTQDLHKALEDRVSAFHGMQDTILYSSCFDANGGLFETILSSDDAIVTDSLNHASIIDGIRLCRAHRYIYKHNRMDDLRHILQKARSGVGPKDDPLSAPIRRIMIATDGIFSMDGDVADLHKIVDLAEEFNAMVMVDESHATGFFGPNGRGAADHCGVLSKVDVITSTLGKAMGGASGGFVTGKREIIAMLRQRSRPYLFSNTLAPSIAMASIKAFDLVDRHPELREHLRENTQIFRKVMTERGFSIVPGIHPIVPILLGHFNEDAILAQKMAAELYEEGIYAVGFSYPVVPRGEARIRVQLSAAHSTIQVKTAIECFTRVGKKLKIIK
jgi:glycine C-acetyltransferase